MKNPDAEFVRREPAAIMYSDIAGYTLMMGRDEGKALNAIAVCSEPRFIELLKKVGLST